MTQNLADPNQWYEEYEELSVRQRYQILLDIAAQPINSDWLEEVDMADLLISMSDELHSNNLHEDALKLFQLFKDNHPQFYKHEFSYYDKFMVEYYLYNQQSDLLEDALARFKKYPAKDGEQLFIVLDILTLYEQKDTVISLCQATYKSLKNNSNVPKGAEDELAWLVITNMMENVYQQHQQGEEINWQKFTNDLRPYGYDRDSDWLADIKQVITQGFDSNEFISQLKQKKLHYRAFNSLSTAFYIYMKAEKNMSFVCSQGIWETIFDFFSDRDLNFKQQANPNTFFSFKKSDLDSYLTAKLHGFLSMQQAQGFATLWGLPYLYDFLLKQEIIREQVHRKTLGIINQLKTELLEAYEDNWQLWRYDFVNRWQPDNSTSQETLEKQQKLFTTSYEKSEPLSDVPGEGKLESFFGEMAEKLGLDLDKFPTDEDEAGTINSEDDVTIEAETTPIEERPQRKLKKGKNKKSNLGLAAQLYKK